MTTPQRDASKDNRASVRNSQLLQTGPRLGSRSPSSIPSSPTSVHSSSSAIFERDIEPLAPSPSSTLHHHHPHPPNPHRMPRSGNTQQIEQSVPSVLDSAAAVLTGLGAEEDEYVAVLAPSPGATGIAAELGLGGSSNGGLFGGSGWASPHSSRSRSPSPGAPMNRHSLLLSLPSPPPSSTLPVAGTSQTSTSQPTSATASPSRPIIQTQPMPLSPSMSQSSSDQQQPSSTPTSAYYSLASLSSAGSSPRTTILEHPADGFEDHATPTSTAASPFAAHLSLAPSIANGGPISPTGTTSTYTAPTISHPPSPQHNATKRLSFLSYSDLLSSTPTSTLTLSSLTSSALASDPPPHIPSVTGFTQAAIDKVHSAASSVHRGLGERAIDPVLMEEDGGEWEREGFGQGLEERLEALNIGG
ncbi:hypothetical protein JAAARDRAFT_62061 [Jaapia argillacea MUCL 33604]|uniref:Uncharacterized protein n=1 Tax=Jaapia argillacea MUCL 33604 TaxID=933084 RepID=A0A067PPS8_9AGAM|nr:hypothetical protein JAAARDRAFT_62061 [Jaapia argillacea MUCL 33604]